MTKVPRFPSADVVFFLQGYHVQISARSDRDLTPEGIVQKVADSSGSKYSAGTENPAPTSSASKPEVATKPVFTPSRTVGSFKPLAGTRQTTATKREDVDEEGWGADAPQVTRTQLEKVQPAYQPTKVNIDDLKSQKPPSSSSTVGRNEAGSSPDVVKGTYQPVGKVDIAAIRRQATESGQSGGDRPAPVKGAYEPVGKVDIGAMRAKSQGTPDTPQSPPSNVSPAATGGSRGSDGLNGQERLTSLPKPKVTNKIGGNAAFTGTKAPAPGGFEAKPAPSAAPVGGASRTFADEGGKTPAQVWAEKKAKERGGTPAAMSGDPQQPLQTQGSGQGGWKSSYTGKTWAPVQTTHTGASSHSADTQDRADERQSQDEETQAGNMGAIREKFANAAPMGAPAPAGYERAAPPPPVAETTKPVSDDEAPAPSLPVRPRPEEPDEEARQNVPPPPAQPRSPTPEASSPVRGGSPIRVAAPVGRGSADERVAGARDEQESPPPVLPVRSVSEKVPEEAKLEQEPAHDPARTATEAAAPVGQESDGTRAIAQYDYERAEEDELEVREGEVVTNIEMIDAEWWMGVNPRGEQGLFPSNYVELVKDSDAGPPLPSQQAETEDQHAMSGGGGQRPNATTLYDYDAAEDNEIGFPDGATITDIVGSNAPRCAPGVIVIIGVVLTFARLLQDFVGDDWWYGVYNGAAGLFPANYVQLND